jgi:NADPH-dependent ferric siderophore reductase
MIVSLVVAAIAAYFAFDFVRSYKTTVGSIWARSVAATKSSATILWARFSVVVTAAVGGLAYLADLVNAPQVATAITTYLKPSVVAAIMVASAVLTEWARRRTLPSS